MLEALRKNLPGSLPEELREPFRGYLRETLPVTRTRTFEILY